MWISKSRWFALHSAVSASDAKAASAQQMVDILQKRVNILQKLVVTNAADAGELILARGRDAQKISYLKDREASLSGSIQLLTLKLDLLAAESGKSFELVPEVPQRVVPAEPAHWELRKAKK